MNRLAIYVGNGWQSHYRKAFERLLQAERTGSTAWTWNWAAAAWPVWFVYRGLLGTSLVLGIIYWLFGFLAYPVMFVVQGCIGDRLLFSKAMSDVRRPGLRKSREMLARVGQPGQ